MNTNKVILICIILLLIFILYMCFIRKKEAFSFENLIPNNGSFTTPASNDNIITNPLYSYEFVNLLDTSIKLNISYTHENHTVYTDNNLSYYSVTLKIINGNSQDDKTYYARAKKNQGDNLYQNYELFLLNEKTKALEFNIIIAYSKYWNLSKYIMKDQNKEAHSVDTYLDKNVLTYVENLFNFADKFINLTETNSKMGSFTTPASNNGLGTTPASNNNGFVTTPASNNSFFTTPATNSFFTTPATNSFFTTPATNSFFTTPASNNNGFVTTPASNNSFFTTPATNSFFTTPASNNGLGTTPATNSFFTTPATNSFFTTPATNSFFTTPAATTVICKTNVEDVVYNKLPYTILYKDINLDNHDYFSKYLILKTDESNNIGNIVSKVYLNNSNSDDTCCIFKYDFDTILNSYKHNGKQISILANNRISYNNNIYERLTLSNTYTLSLFDEFDPTQSQTTQSQTTQSQTTQSQTTQSQTTPYNVILVELQFNMFLYGTLYEPNSYIRITVSMERAVQVALKLFQLNYPDNPEYLTKIKTKYDDNPECNQELIFEFKPSGLSSLSNEADEQVFINKHTDKIYMREFTENNNDNHREYIYFNGKDSKLLIVDKDTVNGADVWSINKFALNIVTNNKSIEHTYPVVTHDIKDHKLHNHIDNSESTPGLGEHGRNKHIHNFFDEHHHTEISNTDLNDNYLFKDIKSYKETKHNIDVYIDKIIELYNNEGHTSLKNLFNNNIYLTDIPPYDMYYNKIKHLNIQSNDVRLKLILREILYNEFLNKVEGKTNPANPLNPNNLPCMYYTDFNCPENRCTKVSNLRNLNIKCIPTNKKKVSTCLDLYGKNNCEKHYIDDEANTCTWSEWTGATGIKLGKCSGDGNVAKIKEKCNENEYLIRKYGKGELSETLIDSICLSNGEETNKLLYDNPNYINTKHIKNHNGIDIGNGILKSICTTNNTENTDNPNTWDNDNCYNPKELECHKNSKETCDISKKHYFDQSSELYDVNKNQVCFWRPLHYSKNPDYPNKYTEKGICENLL